MSTTFLMKLTGASFPEIVRDLGRKAGKQLLLILLELYPR